jgi:hypothetical protein
LISVAFADPVSVDTTNGTPTLALNDNEVATYDLDASTATTLVFSYTVQAGDSTPELETAASGISLNGATITDLVTNAPADLSGAQSAVPAGDLVVDTTPPPAPSAPILATASEAGGNSGIANAWDPIFTGTGEAGTTVTLYADDIDVGTATAGTSGDYSVTQTSSLTGGSYTYTVTATDAGGNISAESGGTVVELPGPAVIGGTKGGQGTVLDAPIAPFASATITDPNPGATDTLTITIGGAGGTLSGTGLGGGTGGVYTLSGTAGAVTGELDALVFTPSPSPSETASTSTFSLSDATSSYAGVATDTGTSVIDYGVGTIVDVTPSIPTATLGVGDKLAITLTTSSPVTVTGTPTLALDNNGIATYDGAASTDTALVFDYTVAAD